VEPKASRPYMPGYGTVGPHEGTGLLPWAWATERLTRSHDYWVGTVSPDHRPHVTPVWGVWHKNALWFSCSNGSRKARNLDADPHCAVTTDNPLEPVVVEGVAERRTDVKPFVDRTNAKYETDYSVEFFAANALWRVEPTWVFALTESDFTGSPTRWQL
jgi:hypothetical protein